jgi:hypothetical protein
LLAIIFAIIQEKCNNKKNEFSDDRDRDYENGCVGVYRLTFSYKMNLLSFRAYCYAWHYVYYYALHYVYCYAWRPFSRFYYALHSYPYLRLLLMVQRVQVLNLEKASFLLVFPMMIGLLPFY